MQFKRTFLVGVLVARVAFAQAVSDAKLRSKIATVRYPPLAEMARIYGDVRLNVAAGAVTVLTGHPLLAPVAVESAKSLESIYGQKNIDMIYHFAFVDTAISLQWVAVKRGNAFQRAILRMIGRKPERVVLEYQCEEGHPPANEVVVSGEDIEIWIYGRTHCISTQAAALLARR